MKHLRKFNESISSSILDEIVPFIMEHAPYIKSLSSLQHLFNFKDVLTWKSDESYNIKNFCNFEVIRHQIFYSLDSEKLTSIFNEGMETLSTNQNVLKQVEYVCSLEKQCLKEEVDKEVSTLSMLKVVLPEIKTEFLILVRMYLILKWTVWNKVSLIEDSLVELEDEKIKYEIFLTCDIYPEWLIQSPVVMGIRNNARILNVLSQLDRRMVGRSNFNVSSNGNNYYYRIIHYTK